MNRDSETKSRVVRLNQPPKPECCRESGQNSVAEGNAARTNSWKRTPGASQAASGSRTRLKPSSLETTLHLQVGTPSPPRNPTRRRPRWVRFPETGRGRSAWPAKPRVVWKLGGPAPSRRANCGSDRVSQRNDQKCWLREGRESHRLVAVRGQARGQPGPRGQHADPAGTGHPRP